MPPTLLFPWKTTVLPHSPCARQLTEVVRSSQRIVAGAAAFQLGENKAQVTSQHNATGPPLKSFLFDLEGDQIEAYAEHALRALNHVMTTFGSLELHDRVAIVVPDERFAAAFRAPLADALLAQFPSRPFTLVSAQEAAASALPSAGERGKEGEWLVLDSIAAMDGLERLIIIAVGLDAVIDEGSGSSTLETRSRLYRALTRAHMMAVVVNEFLPGGWLEFLGHVSLKKDEKKFNLKDEMENKIKADAADGVMSWRLLLEKDAAQKVQKLAKQRQASKGNLSNHAAKTESKPDPAGDKPGESTPKAESKPGDKPKNVAQSVWDTSGNETAKASGWPVFNPIQPDQPEPRPKPPVPPKLQSRADALNAPGAWHFMISYAQGSDRGSMLAQMLRSSLMELGYTVWLDVRRSLGSNLRDLNERSDVRCRYHR